MATAGVVWAQCLGEGAKERVLSVAAPALGVLGLLAETVLDHIITAWDWARARISGAWPHCALAWLCAGAALHTRRRGLRDVVPACPLTAAAARRAPPARPQAPAKEARRRRRTLSRWRRWTRRTTAARPCSRARGERRPCVHVACPREGWPRPARSPAGAPDVGCTISRCFIPSRSRLARFESCVHKRYLQTMQHTYIRTAGVARGGGTLKVATR